MCYMVHEYIYKYHIIVHSVLGYVLVPLEIFPTAFPSLSELQTLISCHTETIVLLNAIITLSESFIEIVLKILNTIILFGVVYFR